MTDASPAEQVETAADFGDDPGAFARRWISELDLADKAQANWVTRSRKIIGKYEVEAKNEDYSTDINSRRFSLFWSNIQTLQPAVLARVPTAVVSRRWKDSDPVGRTASEIVERALNFGLDMQDFAEPLFGVRDDLLLVGRGQCWVRYVPHMRTETPTTAMPAAVAPSGGPSPAAGGEASEAPDAEPVQVAENAEAYEVVAWEEAVVDHVTWNDFLHNPARKWAEVRWVARRVFMTREELEDRFPKCGKDVPLDYEPENYTGPDDEREQFKKAAVYEIWDKLSRKAIWINKGYPQEALDQRDDPLGLQDFFPCPRPVFGTKASKLVPTPDYIYYQSQLRDVDDLTARIGLLMEALKVRGFYAAGGDQKQDLSNLFNTGTNTLIPVDSWAAFSEAGGVKGLIEWVPIDMVAVTLKACVDSRKQLIDDVYQITGIADIMRGDTDPNETAAAQRLKSSWGSSRVRDKQKDLERFARDLLRLLAQIIAGKFSPETLSAMTNIQLLPSPEAKQALMQQLQASAAQQARAAQQAQAMGQPPPPPVQPPAGVADMLNKPTWQEVEGLLRDNALRAFRIEVETDSTIEPNDQEEKQRRIEFVTAIGDYVAKALPAIQLAPAMLPVIVEGLKFLVRGFRVGREMEDVIDRALDQLQAGGGMQPPQQQGKQGNPQVDAAKAQAASTSAQADVMNAQTRQFQAQTERGAAMTDAQIRQAEVAAEERRTAADRATELHMHGEGLKADMQQAVVHGVERRLVREMNGPSPRADTQ